jgi:hypothetical protein
VRNTNSVYACCKVLMAVFLKLQLQEKYVQQQDELRIIREQSAQKDLKIRRLEDQLRLARTFDSSSKLYQSHSESVIGVKGHGGTSIGVKGVC